MKPSSPHGLNTRGHTTAHDLNRRGRTIARPRIALTLAGKRMAATPAAFVFALALSAIGPAPAQAAEYALTPLPPHSAQFTGLFEEVIQNSIQHWNKGVVPYPAFVQMFRSGRGMFAQGEMWGKAVRSGSMFYRYTHDPELKELLRKTVADLISTRRANGSISCSPVDKQPDGPGGDLWERKYVLLGLDEYYEHVERDPAVLKAMMDEADSVIAQIGPPPKVRIVDQGWSANHIESSTILEPILRLYNRTRRQAYLDFAKYIVEVEGGSKGYNIIQQALDNLPPEKIGGPYPKAYEMMSLFEGVVEYYRVSNDKRWKTAALNLHRNIREKEITIIGNGGGDQPYHPDVMGEAWDNTAVEQTNPAITRMMETCAGVTWMKLCTRLMQLTANSTMADDIERYVYNGLLGAMKPAGDGFSYVNLLNGVKTNPEGWGAKIDNVYVTCCNLNGPMGLAYLPYVAVMSSPQGPVINLFNPGKFQALAPGDHRVDLEIVTDYPRTGEIKIKVNPHQIEHYAIWIRIPAWSLQTELRVNKKTLAVTPGTYAKIERSWFDGDRISLSLDMRCRLIDSPRGSNRAGDNRQALIRGPIVLARSESLDPDFDKPVSIAADPDGVVAVQHLSVDTTGSHLAFTVPTTDGRSFTAVDYASVDSWSGKRICTWLPKVTSSQPAAR